MEIMFFILNSAEVEKCDKQIAEFSKSQTGEKATFLRFTEDMDFQLYGIGPQHIREDHFLELAAEFSKLIQEQLLAGMIIDNAGFDGAWIYHRGALKSSFATTEESRIPTNSISDDPVTEGLKTFAMPQVQVGHIYAIVESCVEPVEIDLVAMDATRTQIQEQGKFERKFRARATDYYNNCAKYNTQDYHKYKAEGDMNRYFGFALQRGWAVPFLLSDWKAALEPIRDYCSLEEEKLKYYMENPKDDGYLESVLASSERALIHLLGERPGDARLTWELAHSYAPKRGWFSEAKALCTNALAKDLVETSRLNDIEAAQAAAVTRGCSAENLDAYVSYIDLNYSLFSGQRKKIELCLESFVADFYKISKLDFLSVCFLSRPRSFYRAFETLVKNILDGSPKAIDAAWEMLWYDTGIDSSSTLAIKSMEQLARCCAGEQLNGNFKQEFPTMAGFIERVLLSRSC